MEEEVKYVTILDLAIHRGAVESEDGHINGAEFARVGLSIMGGCELCGETLGCYNGYPSKSGYWRCHACLGDLGWEDVAQADKDIFGQEKEENHE